MEQRRDAFKPNTAVFQHSGVFTSHWRALGAAVVGKDIVLDGFLEKGQNLVFHFRWNVLQQPKLLTLLEDRLRIGVDRSIDLGQLFQEDPDSGLVLVQKLPGRKKRLVAGLDVAERQDNELVRRFLH